MIAILADPAQFADCAADIRIAPKRRRARERMRQR